MQDTSLPLSERLKMAQVLARQARCEAFVDYAPIVAGETIRPITIDTYNALCAFTNAFVTGEAISFEDIANFIWIHHADFGQFNREEKQRVTRRVWSALNPSFPGVCNAFRVLTTFPGFRFARFASKPTATERTADAIDAIRGLMREATRDIPKDDDNGEPLPFAFQAYVLNLFRRELGLSFEETRSLPLKQLAQHLREIIHHLSRGKALLLTPEEAEVWREHLKQREKPASVAGSA